MIAIKERNPLRMGSYFDYELENGELLHSSEWNGESYTTDTGRYTPVHRFDVEDIDLEAIEENSPEWDRAVEIIGFED